MRKRNLILIIMLLVLSGVTLVYNKSATRNNRHTNQTKTNISVVMTPNGLTRTNGNQKLVAKNAEEPDIAVEKAAIEKKYFQGLIDKAQLVRSLYLLENMKSQDFYGKVIDQDGNPLGDAAVSGELVLNDGTYGGIQTQKHSTVSDGNGLFDFTGIHGAGLSVRVSKTGYEIEGKNQVYKGPASGKMSPADRATFTLWDTNSYEKLIVWNKSFEIVPDGKPHFINLTDGTISEQESGDLKVWIQYTNQVTRGQLYDWFAGIEVLNGGLLEVQQESMNSGFSEEFAIPMYTAPKDGYVSSFSHKGQIKGGQNGEIGHRYFYLLLKNGKEYGRMSINLFAPYGRLYPGLIRVSYVINPSGSRILR